LKKGKENWNARTRINNQNGETQTNAVLTLDSDFFQLVIEVSLFSAKVGIVSFLKGRDHYRR